jgi:hypothetical protein
MAMHSDEPTGQHPPQLEKRSRARGTPSDEVVAEREVTRDASARTFTEAERRRAAIYLIEREAIRLRRAQVKLDARSAASADDVSLNQYRRPPRSDAKAGPTVLDRAMKGVRSLLRTDKRNRSRSDAGSDDNERRTTADA